MGRRKRIRNKSLQVNALKKCERCGREDRLERDHIIPLSKGGSDISENLHYLCNICHKFRHAEDNVLRAIKKHERRVQLLREKLSKEQLKSWKIDMWKYRLQILKDLNPHGADKYTSYWSDVKTHSSVWYYRASKASKTSHPPEKPEIKIQSILRVVVSPPELNR